MRSNGHKNIYLTKEELKKLLETAKKYNKEHYIIFYLSYFCALRVSELINLKCKNYDKSSGELRIERLKGSINKTYTLPSELKKSIDKIVDGREDEEYIFVTNWCRQYHRSRLYILFKRYIVLSKISIDKGFFHILKHSICTHLINEGLDLIETQNWMGHKNVNNTILYYSSSVKQQENLQKKVGKMFNFIG